MLRITMNKSASGAKKYYSESYYKEGKDVQLDYYAEKNQTIGKWGGSGALMLELGLDIDKNDFSKLCDNKNPINGKSLTPRNDKERRVGYDFTFNASKSVSIAYAFGDENDKKEILKAFQDSVASAMSEIETGMQARVRNQKQNISRETGNIVYGEFTHFTTRPVEGLTDPHLHSHCFVFNATYDKQDKKWKAGQFGQIKQDAPYYESFFHSEFANRLSKLGYDIERTKSGLEIKGLKKETLEKFSRRTKEIEEFATKNNITDSKEKSKIGAKTRESKRKSKSQEKEADEWYNRLSEDEKKDISQLKRPTGSDSAEPYNFEKAKQALQYSLNHHLERKSVASDKEILATAIKASIGEATPDCIKKALIANIDVIRVKEGNRTLLTTKAALHEEKQLIVNALSFKGRFRPINDNYVLKSDKLNPQQRKAVHHALSTSDGISIIAGKAGTGKTTLMQQVKRGIKESGREIYAFAPSSEASRIVQREEGFLNADTVASLISSQAIQNKLKDQVMWVDEAGQLSNKDLNKIFVIAKEQNARIILSGDIRQHSSVERGDALRVIQKYAGISPITVSKIQRQKNNDYKKAVEFLSDAKIEHGFKKLDQIGAINEIEDTKTRIEAVAHDYFDSTYNSKKPKNTLVVSPTHAEANLITNEIRNKMRNEKILVGEERLFISYKSLQFTNAEKQNADSYQIGQTIKYHQNVKGITAGTKLKVSSVCDNKILAVDHKNKIHEIDKQTSDRFNVFEESKISVSVGDKIRITENCKGLDGKRLFNGTSHYITDFDKLGNIKLSNGSTLSHLSGSFSYGYVMTSHASQGKTADKVIISQGSQSFKATSREQFYVSVSRGREAVSIYTDCKSDLLKAVTNTSERISATELLEKGQMNKKTEVIKNIQGKAINALEKIKNLRQHEYALQRNNRTKETGKTK